MLVPGQKRVSFIGHSLLASLAFLLSSLLWELPHYFLHWRRKALLQALVVFLRANDGVLMRFEVLGSPLASQLEAVDYRLIEVNFWRQHNRRRVRLQEHLSDRCAKTSAIESGLVLRDVNFVALRAVDFNAARPHFVAEPDRQGFLLVTKCARTEPILGRQITMVEYSHALHVTKRFEYLP